MIRNLSSKTAQDIYDGVASHHARRLPKELQVKAQRLLDKLDAAIYLETLKPSPGNRLEKLKGDLVEFWSLRINDQWRIIFRWEEGDTLDVNIVDYH